MIQDLNMAPCLLLKVKFYRNMVKLTHLYTVFRYFFSIKADLNNDYRIYMT